jgi:hypothetical protein
MQKWEYKRYISDVHEVAEDGFEQKLNAFGQDGWDLVASFDRERGGNSKEVFFLFKRPRA